MIKNTLHNGKAVTCVKLLCFIENKLTQTQLFVGVFGLVYKSEKYNVEVKHIRKCVDTLNLVSGPINSLIKPAFKIEDKLCIPPKVWDPRM